MIKDNPKDASAVVLFYKKKILMQLRSKNKKIFYPEYWGCFGGSKKNNETYLDCAVREITEETNIKFKKDEFIFFFKLNFFIKFSNKKFIRKFFFLKINNIKKFKEKFRLNEGFNCNFFSNLQINKLSKVVPYDKYAIDVFFKIYSKNLKSTKF